MELDHGTTERRRIIVSGVVQGVGSPVGAQGEREFRIEASAERRELASLGFGVLTHRRVPPNDGGISFGQAAIAARRVD